MDIEQRLTNEFQRTAQGSAVVDGPTVDEMGEVIDKRRSRNRYGGVGVVALLASAILIGSIVTGGDSSSSIIAGEGDAQVSSEAMDDETPSAVAPDAGTGESEVEEASADGAADDPAEEDTADRTTAVDDGTEVLDLANAPALLDIAQRSLQVDGGDVDVERRQSAVELAASSGVLVVPTDDGYMGLATRFGSSISSLAISSSNGLDWEELAVSGIPSGATASQLVEYDGTFVALFEAYDANAQQRRTYVGTSTDMADWELTQLPGQPFATALAVGEAGVVVLGDNEEPDIWFGPLGGPYPRTARLAATAVSGITMLDDEILVAGRSAEGATIFRSADGVDWVGEALSSLDIPGTPAVTVSEGTIILANADGNENVSLVSTDAGQTWDQVNASGQEMAVSENTLGMLSSDGTAVAIADDDSFVQADIGVEEGDRLSLLAAGDDEVVLLQATESGATWIVASR